MLKLYYYIMCKYKKRNRYYTSYHKKYDYYYTLDVLLL